MPDDLVITIDDVVACGHCAKGARRWFDRYGIDFRDFLKNGVPAQVVLDTGDAFAEQVVAAKRERLARG